MERVVVVGASLAGLRAAEALRRRGFAGDITLVGEEPHMPYDRPPLSKQVLSGQWPPERTRFRQRDGFEGLRLDMRLGVRAGAVDTSANTVTLADGTALGFERLLIATGAAARWLPGTKGMPGVHVVRTLDDALGLRAELQPGKRVVIVGAGFIGLEVASVCRGMGLPVTVVDPLPLPLSPSIGSQMAEAVCGLHRAEGVSLLTGVGVTAVRDLGDAREIALADGRTLAADVVVVGIGVRPSTDWLSSSGIKLDPRDGAVVVGSDCQTSAPGVFAAGDVARFEHGTLGRSMRIEHWTHAVEMANAAVAHLLCAEDAEPFAPVPYVWSDQYDVKLQFAGVIAPDDAFELLAGDPGARKLLGIYQRAGRLTGVLAWNTPVGLIKGRKLLAQGASVEEARTTLA